MKKKSPAPASSKRAAAETAARGAAFPVVGVGASAGGLEALSQLLKALPRDTGMGFVIVQHLAPDHASGLTEILSRVTAMPVSEVREEPAVEPDHVYVIPPGRDMIIEGGHLRLRPQVREARHRGIDQFFRSLAEDSGHLAIGVVLSGGATDGTGGLEEIKACGGVTFAQDGSAQHDSMPRSAVASGCVDFVLPPAGIAREIARIARHPYVAAEEDAGEPAHGRIAEMMRRATGVDFTGYKAATMQRRIHRRMMVHRIETLADYEQHLRAVPGEMEALYQDVLISVTSFFRNPEAFEALAQKIFPKLLADRSRHDPVRVWALGCSTGEEAYSLAMVFAECAEAARSHAQLQLFATDLNAVGIDKARAGCYPRSIAQDVSPERLRRFFTEEDGRYRVNKSIRERIVFSRHNVLADPSFSRVDFISCRNLLIYLEPVLQQQVLPLLHYALKPGGHLWLGSSESPGAWRALFEVEDARHKIFARRPGPTPPGPRFRPAAQSSAIFPPPAPGPREVPATALHRDAERVLLAKYAPPGVVVNVQLQVVQFRGETGAYLAPAAGLASYELLKMLREGLLVPVRAALARAQKEGRAVREEGARVKGAGSRALAIEVIPLKAGPGREEGFVILFDEGTHPPAAGAAPLPAGQGTEQENGHEGNDAAEVARLTQELAATREYLQSVIEQQDAINEELQSANEEAQSANEEMQSVNEELETSKEEIQSSNEELATVNDELNARNTDLNALNNDLANVLASPLLAILIFTRDLRLRRFTPAAEKILHLAGGDMGRPLADIKLSLTMPDLASLLREVLDATGAHEREVRDAQGRWHSLRARPYLTHDRKIDGVVVTFVDVDTLRRARDFAESIVAGVRGPLVVLDAALRVRTATPAFYEYFGITPAEAERRPFFDLAHRQWDVPALRTLLEEILPRENEITGYDMRYVLEQLGPRTLRLNAKRLAQSADSEPLIMLSIEDVTARAMADEARARLAAIVESSDDAIISKNLDGIITSWNRGAERIFGYTAAEIVGRPVLTLIPENRHGEEEKILGHLRRGERLEHFETVRRRKDGTLFHVSLTSSPIVDGTGKIIGASKIARDITERQRAEHALRESEARYRSIIDSSPDCFKVLDLAGNLLSLEAGQELLGIPDATPYLGQPWLDFWTRAEDRAAAEAAIATAAAGCEAKFVGFFRTLHGLDKWWDVAIAPMSGADGRPARLLAVSRDVTERHEMEEMLATRAQQLAHADRSKDEFLAMLAHELRNPLAPLRNATEILQLEKSSADEHAQAHRIIGRQIENMSRMLDDLLDVARITEGKITLRTKPVALEAVLTAATSLARSGCAARQQKLTLALPAEPVWLEADATRLEQVFGNLLTNACKYSGDGSHIALSAEVAGSSPSEPDEERKLPGRGGPGKETTGRREVIVRVIDDGIGIDAELLPRIFELFVQSSRTLDRAHGGLGIGLTLVQRLVKLHGGSIEARSDGLGQGAEFIVRLPILAGPPPIAPLPPRPAQERPRRILIVDDNTDSARSLAMLQSRRGHETRTAFTGPDAVTAAAEFLPEAVLLDIGLPGMDGFEVARRIRAMPALAGALLIATTGYASEEDRLQCRAVGFDEHLVKPVDLEVLRDWLARHPRLAAKG